MVSELVVVLVFVEVPWVVVVVVDVSWVVVVVVEVCVA